MYNIDHLLWNVGWSFIKLLLIVLQRFYPINNNPSTQHQTKIRQ